MSTNSRRPVRRITLLLAAATLALAACGDDTAAPAGDDGSLPPVSRDAPGGGAIEHPVAADEVVFLYAEVGGFTTRDYQFQRIPAVLVSGDGRVFTPGPQIAIYPGPMLPSVEVRSITEEGIQRLLAAARDAGLFADVEYADDTNIADATTARVVVDADGTTWVHEAYAIGSAPFGEGETSPERIALSDFLIALGDLPSVVGATELGDAAAFQPEEFVVEAVVADDLSGFGGDVEPTIVEWPAETGIRLAELVATPGTESCTTVSAAAFGALFAGANQLTFFADGDTTYQVLVRPVLPGDDCA